MDVVDFRRRRGGDVFGDMGVGSRDKGQVTARTRARG